MTSIFIAALTLLSLAVAPVYGYGYYYGEGDDYNYGGIVKEPSDDVRDATSAPSPPAKAELMAVFRDFTGYQVRERATQCTFSRSRKPSCLPL